MGFIRLAGQLLEPRCIYIYASSPFLGVFRVRAQDLLALLVRPHLPGGHNRVDAALLQCMQHEGSARRDITQSARCKVQLQHAEALRHGAGVRQSVHTEAPGHREMHPARVSEPSHVRHVGLLGEKTATCRAQSRGGKQRGTLHAATWQDGGARFRQMLPGMYERVEATLLQEQNSEGLRNDDVCPAGQACWIAKVSNA